MYDNGATSWCASLGWLALFNSGRRHCDITINPYGPTKVAIVRDESHFGGAAGFECSTQERRELSVQLIATGVLGVVLVTLAPYLATSLAFRISAGGLVSVLLFSLLAAIFLMRCAAAGTLTAEQAALRESDTAQRRTLTVVRTLVSL